MPSDGCEPDNLWHCIDAQKRPPAAPPGRRLPSDLYSHDPIQNWVQAVSASLRAGRRRPAGAKLARKRLETAIQRSLAANYARSASRPHAVPGRCRVLLATAFVLLLAAVLAASLFLRHAMTE